MENFKSFKGGKSKAKKGLLRFNPALEQFTDELLVQVDGEWGFYTDAAEALLAPASDAATDTGSESGSESLEGDDTNVEPVASGNMFGNIANTLNAVAVVAKPAPAQRTPAADRAPYTIEKVRPEQNGVKRPSAGGLCRAVWDEMDALRETLGECPTPNMVRAAAAENNWNANNAMIEYYQWRKYNGIAGRIVKKAAPAATTQQADETAPV